MIARSASVPALCRLLDEGDRCDFAPRSNEALLSCFHPASRSSRRLMPSLDLRRPRSQTDLQALNLSPFNVSGCRTVRETKRDRRAENVSTCNERCEPLVRFTKEATVSSTKKSDAQNCVLSGCISASCGHFSFGLKVTDTAGVASMSDTPAANSEGGFGGRGGKRTGYGGADGSRRNFDGPVPESADIRYKMLLQSDPQNPLLLRNYAQFLSEAKHDHKGAEEYYEPAILACPSDGEVLSMYAKHVWDVHKDAKRAGNYFDQAVKASPDDSHILGSHASFLWQSEEEEGFADVSQPSVPPSQLICAAPALSLMVSA